MFGDHKEKIELLADKQDLAIMILSATRYAIPRHFTEAVTPFQELIIDNINFLPTCYVQQIIEEIECEQRIEENRKFFSNEKPDRLNPLRDYIKSSLTYIENNPDSKYNEFKELLSKTLEMSNNFCFESDYYTSSWCNTNYLNFFKEALKKELEQRNNQ